jgi:hypothetical protein
LAGDYGLDVLGDMAFLPENLDIAEMVIWAKENLSDEEFHTIQGIALGYPPKEVDDWVEGWKANTATSPTRLAR